MVRVNTTATSRATRTCSCRKQEALASRMTCWNTWNDKARLPRTKSERLGVVHLVFAFKASYAFALGQAGTIAGANDSSCAELDMKVVLFPGCFLQCEV